MENSSIDHVNGGQPSNVNQSSGILTENLPQAQAADENIEEVVQDEVQRAVQEALNRQASGRVAQPPLATVLRRPRNNRSADSERGDDEEESVGEENNKIKKLCGLPKWLFYFLVVLVAAGTAGGFVSATSPNGNDIMATDIPSMSPTALTPTILAGLLYPNRDLDDISPAQHDAVRWILMEDNYFLPHPAVITTELLERHALATLYFGLGGENWATLANNWLSPGISHCEWENVGCDDTASVISLQFEFEGLEGSLPEEIGRLSNLNELLLRNNDKLTGQLPIQFYDLTSLTMLDVRSCQLTGTVPTYIGRLSMLQKLDFTGNLMHGQLPSEVGLLSNLEQVLLADNSFSGQIPAEILQWTRVQIFELYGNEFTGSFPEVRLEQLESLDISGNRLNSTFPKELLASATNLTSLTFNGNDLGPTLPMELFTLGKLQNLFLSNISLSGELPAEVGNLTYLTQLVLSDNPNIKGPLPSEVGNLRLLEYLHMDRATLSASTLPTELGRLSNLVYLSFENCSLVGSIPTEFGNLAELNYLYLNDNSLGGPIIPNFIGNMGNLRKIQLHNNLLTSTIPAQLSRLTSLFHINLSNNSLTGRVPAQLHRLRDTIQNVYLYGNKLTGGLENLFCGSPPFLKEFQVDCGLVCKCCTPECVSFDDITRGGDP